MILQWVETQFDSAHAPEHLPGEVHGHTWFVRASKHVDPEAYIPDVSAWRGKIDGICETFDHRILMRGEGLAEQLAQQIGQITEAVEVEVWRMTRAGRMGATWRA